MSAQPGGGGKTPKSGARAIPTLTEVVRPNDLMRSTTDGEQAGQPAVSVLAGRSTPDSANSDAMAHRLMQRVDLVLERRLRELVSLVVAEHVSTLAPRLRDVVEQAVRESVSEALSKELTQTPSAQVRPPSS